MQDELPAAIGRVEVEALDPFLRTLVFTDGTVTRALAVRTLAPTAVERVAQAEVAIAADVAGSLEIQQGELAVRRRAAIGFQAGPPVIWAESHLLPERLPPGFMRLLDGAPDGIGQSLQRVALESTRELLWFGCEAPPPWASPTAGASGRTICRLYRIVCERRPAILIHESFAVEERAGLLCLAGLAPEISAEQPLEAGR